MLHFVTIGDIPISSKTYDRLSSSRKAFFLNKRFKQKTFVKTLLNASRQEKMNVLIKIQKYLSDLLESLFRPPPEAPCPKSQTDSLEKPSEKPSESSNLIIE